MNQTTHARHDLQACITACTRCHQICLQTGMNHCLETGEEHVEPNHFRLLMNCAEICEACAINCERVGDMDGCVKAYRDCAKTCRQMVNMRHSIDMAVSV